MVRRQAGLIAGMADFSRSTLLDGGEKLHLLHVDVGRYLDDIVAHFVSSIPMRLAAFTRAHADCDLPALRREAHKLKGAAATLGAIRLVDLCVELESLCQAERLPPANLLTVLGDDAWESIRLMHGVLDRLRGERD
ncbi:MAG: Hpt domain-containing protein [Magnetococcales bacterium]|nr:Hpt domain-containing protein [Magnetococcales bacterium]